MVNTDKETTPSRALPGAARRAVYSALGLGVVGGMVAVLGAPVKWF
jgi:hypothetical protein